MDDKTLFLKFSAYSKFGSIQGNIHMNLINDYL